MPREVSGILRQSCSLKSLERKSRLRSIKRNATFECVCHCFISLLLLLAENTVRPDKRHFKLHMERHIGRFLFGDHYNGHVPFPHSPHVKTLCEFLHSALTLSTQQPHFVLELLERCYMNKFFLQQLVECFECKPWNN